MIRWFKPDGFTVPLAEADVQVGGRYRILMVDPEGKEYDLTGVYREVVPGKRLSMTWNWADQPGEESLLTISLKKKAEGTELELVHEGFLDRGPEVKTHQEGWSEALEHLESVVLDRPPFLEMTRHYPVAPEKVYRAWTDPQALGRWFGPGGAQPVASAELDVRVGGRFRILFGGAEGRDHEVQGVYREVVPDRRLVFTWTWPRTTPERESLITIVFQAAGSGTDMVFRQERFFDETVRDNHRSGWTESFEKLGQALAGAGSGLANAH